MKNENAKQTTKTIKIGNTTFTVTSFFGAQNTLEAILETHAINKVLEEIKKI